MRHGAHVAHEAEHDRWLLCLLTHHLVQDHTTLELLVEEVQAHLAGQAHQLPPPLPLRDFVAQARLGLTRERVRQIQNEALSKLKRQMARSGVDRDSLF